MFYADCQSFKRYFSGITLDISKGAHIKLSLFGIIIQNQNNLNASMTLFGIGQGFKSSLMKTLTKLIKSKLDF